MKNLKVSTILFICAFCFNLSYAQTVSYASYRQNTKADKKAAKAAAVKRLVESQNYVFQATYALPSSMQPRALNDGYDFTVTKDKIAVYLPYFGRAYTAPRNLNDGGIKLTTSKFDYKSEAKKDSWNITIKPKADNDPGVKDVQSLKLTVQSNGTATLFVTSLNKQPITFNGYIEEVKSNKL
jgi:hypothetical protein